jgi:hypothetical protein
MNVRFLRDIAYDAVRLWVAMLDSLDAIAASRYERHPRSSIQKLPDQR